MTGRDDAVRRARRALEQAAAGADEAPEHPGYELLEAYVDGRLDAAGRARVENLAAQSVMVAEDLADLMALREGMRDEPVTAARTRPQSAPVRRVALVGAIAASIALVVWLGSRPSSVDRAADVAPVPAPTASVPAPAPSRLTDRERALVAEAVASGRVNLPAAIVALAGKEGTLLGSTAPRAPFAPVAPLGTAVQSTRPTFEWTGVDGDRYTIAIYDEGFTEVARSARVTGTSWTPAIDLRRGAVYRWQVTAHRASGDVTVPAPPQPEARFAVLDERTAALVGEQRARLSDDPLALAILLADAGLFSDARQELLRAQNTPATANAAQTLMRSLPQGTPTITKPAQ